MRPLREVRFNKCPGLAGGYLLIFKNLKSILCIISLSFMFSSLGCALDDNSPESRKRVFVTRTAYDGNLRAQGDGLNGLAGANNLCTQAAADADLGGFWDAWLSDITIDAKDRINDIGPWYLVDKMTVVFNSKKEMEGQPLVPISRDEFFNEVQAGDLATVWTGTSTGGFSSGLDCDGWETIECEAVGSGAFVTGTVGDPRLVQGWTSTIITSDFDAKRRLYCIEG